MALGNAAQACLSAYRDNDGYGFAAFTADGAVLYRQHLAERGHGFARDPSGRAGVAFTRRPGAEMRVFDIGTGRSIRVVRVADDRSFCGHGVFSHDGRLLYATEVVASQGDGRIGVYDTRDDFRRVGELTTWGLDPHEILLMPDRTTLVVANGGILMHSDLPRLKLNIPDMDPSLVYLDSRDGRLIRQVRPPRELHQLSTRHIAVDRRGRVAVAMQYEGSEQDRVPLVALHTPESGADGFRFLSMPEAERVAMKQYCGSAAVDNRGRFLAVSSPRGNRVLVWDLNDGSSRSPASIPMEDVCGLAAGDDAGAFLLSAGTGKRGLWKDGRLENLGSPDGLPQWDNHLLRIT